MTVTSSACKPAASPLRNLTRPCSATVEVQAALSTLRSYPSRPREYSLASQAQGRQPEVVAHCWQPLRAFYLGLLGLLCVLLSVATTSGSIYPRNVSCASSEGDSSFTSSTTFAQLPRVRASETSSQSVKQQQSGCLRRVLCTSPTQRERS